jgi:hypothetical protein
LGVLPYLQVDSFHQRILQLQAYHNWLWIFGSLY